MGLVKSARAYVAISCDYHSVLSNAHQRAVQRAVIVWHQARSPPPPRALHRRCKTLACFQSG